MAAINTGKQNLLQDMSVTIEHESLMTETFGSHKIYVSKIKV